MGVLYSIRLCTKCATFKYVQGAESNSADFKYILPQICTCCAHASNPLKYGVDFLLLIDKRCAHPPKPFTVFMSVLFAHLAHFYGSTSSRRALDTHKPWRRRRSEFSCTYTHSHTNAQVVCTKLSDTFACVRALRARVFPCRTFLCVCRSVGRSRLTRSALRHTRTHARQ